MADFRLRVTYAETGRLVMLSHLEIARALERAVRRAGLPYAVSQGFSPHMKQAFGSALPVGVGGLEEIFDVSLTDYVPPEEALARLRRVRLILCRTRRVTSPRMRRRRQRHIRVRRTRRSWRRLVRAIAK